MSSNLPVYVNAAAKGLKGAQFKFIMSATVWAFQQRIAGATPTGSGMAQAITKEHTELSVKTLSNYCATALTVATARAQWLQAAWVDAEPADVVKALADHVSRELKAGTYTQSEPDIRAWCTGGKSAAAKAQELADQQAADAAAAKAAASAPTVGMVEPPKGDTPSGKTDDKVTSTPEVPAAPALPAPVTVASFTRDSAGVIVPMFHADITSADIAVLMVLLEKEAARLEAPAPAPAPEAVAA